MQIKVKGLDWKHVEKRSDVYQEEADLEAAAPHLKGWKIRRINDWDAPNPLTDCDVAWTIRFNRNNSERPEGTDDGYDGADLMLAGLAYYAPCGRELWHEDAYERARRKHGLQMSYEDWCYKIVKTGYLIVGISVGYRCQSLSISWHDDEFREGVAYIHKDKVKKEFSFDPEVKPEKKAWDYLKAVISEADDYLSGDTWGVVVTRPGGVEHESLWGLIGWDDNADDFISGNGLVPDEKENRELMEQHGGRCVACHSPTWNDLNRTFDDGPFRLTGTLCDECVAKEGAGEALHIPGFMLHAEPCPCQVEMAI